MKINTEAIDSIWGFLAAGVLIGLSGLYFSIPNYPVIFGAIFGISFILSVLDIKETLGDIGWHKFLVPLAILTNIVESVLELSLAGYFLGINIPYLSTRLDPFYSDATMLFNIGAFFIITSLVWLIIWQAVE